MKHFLKNIRLYGAFVGLICIATLLQGGAQKAGKGIGKAIKDVGKEILEQQTPGLGRVKRFRITSKPGQFSSPEAPADLNSHNRSFSQQEISGDSALQRAIRDGLIKKSKGALKQLQNNPHAKSFKLTVDNSTGQKLTKGKAIIPGLDGLIKQIKAPRAAPEAPISRTNNPINTVPPQSLPKESPTTPVMRANPPAVPHQETRLLPKELIQKENQTILVETLQKMFQSRQTSEEVNLLNPETGRLLKAHILRDANTVNVKINGKSLELFLEQEKNYYRLWLKTPNGAQKIAEGQAIATQLKTPQYRSTIPKSSPKLGKQAIKTSTGIGGRIHPLPQPPPQPKPQLYKSSILQGNKHPLPPKNWTPVWPKSKMPITKADTDIQKEDTDQDDNTDVSKKENTHDNKTSEQQKNDGTKPQDTHNNNDEEQQEPQQLTNESSAEQERPENPHNTDYNNGPTFQHKDSPLSGRPTTDSTGTSARPFASSSGPENAYTPYSPAGASDGGSHPHYGMPYGGMSQPEKAGVSIISTNHIIGNATPPEHASDAGTILYPFPIPQATEEQVKDSTTREPIAEQLPSLNAPTFELPTAPTIEQRTKPSSLGSVLHQQGSPLAVTILKVVMLLLHCMCLAVGTLTSGWANMISRILRRLRLA